MKPFHKNCKTLKPIKPNPNGDSFTPPVSPPKEKELPVEQPQIPPKKDGEK
jgi:hypothetical protein